MPHKNSLSRFQTATGKGTEQSELLVRAHRRILITERLTPTARLTFTEFGKMSVKKEEEVDPQRRLLETIRKPQIKLHRIEFGKKEEEVDPQRRLLETIRKPQIKLHRIAASALQP
ncbi:uncharacterized protein PAE49_005492 isoform 3-T3 [Odontesthes bonariensis]|uniref:uncharacterized protein LOC142380473 isoform X3 n=1 Tax=Odontesthes bonariensis TaxID=219752 RepID=UPI003F58576E